VLPSHGHIARSLETDLLPYRSGAQQRIHSDFFRWNVVSHGNNLKNVWNLIFPAEVAFFLGLRWVTSSLADSRWSIQLPRNAIFRSSRLNEAWWRSRQEPNSLFNEVQWDKMVRFIVSKNLPSGLGIWTCFGGSWSFASHAWCREPLSLGQLEGLRQEFYEYPLVKIQKTMENYHF
jgi:hypothetical protein